MEKINLKQAYFDDSKFGKRSPIRKTKTSTKRTLTKSDGVLPDDAIDGKVISVVGNQISVECFFNDSLISVDCTAAGRVISDNSGTLVAVGDLVKIIIDEKHSHDDKTFGTILKIQTRKTKISRIDPANKNREQIIAANIDKVLIFASAFDPPVNPRLIDRFLISCMLGKVKPIVCINKMDLAEEDVFIEYFEFMKDLNVPVYFISVLENTGIDKLKSELIGFETAVLGPSGAGKSSLLNKLIGDEYQAVKEVSLSTSKGMHTTSFSRRFRIPEAGFVIDTPGIREFGIWDLNQDELTLFFKDFEKFYLDCKFSACTHTHEPGCAVKSAVENGLIQQDRYDSYMSLFASMQK